VCPEKRVQIANALTPMYNSGANVIQERRNLLKLKIFIMEDLSQEVRLT
jgi:hypothetical protein